MRQVLLPDRLFDGTQILDQIALVLEGSKIAAVLPASQAGAADHRRLPGITLAPAFLDVQVNGGGGQMVGATTTADQLRQICATHLALGSAGILPTLITDTPKVTAQVIAAGIEAARQGVPGFLGLHLEGPHLDPRRKGAHDAGLIRPMTADDLHLLCTAAERLPRLMVTLAPEAATPDQIRQLAQTGVIVSLGHSDCTAESADRAFAAGARCATHLFNAMSQLGNREPGLVGAVLGGTAGAGVIADGVHVHPQTLRAALAARTEGVFLVSDCMAFAGSDLQEMELGGRQILRRDGRLTLADGTLAGADLTLPRAVGVLVEKVGLDPARALRMASAEPARLLGLEDRFGLIAPGRQADLVALGPDRALAGVCQAGQWIKPPRGL